MVKVRFEGEDIVVSLFQINKINTLFTSVIEEQISNLFTQYEKRVFFDLGKINFIDSSGFEMLHRLIDKSRKTKTEFLICNITEEVKELINLLKIGNELPIVNKEFGSESLMEELELFI